ncbi:murein L,D-transpeptidase family protein [Tardiphaga sp.]|uniref:L,D-transpeptidase family protein n=1 Tax=Tardiphaga sp. TaxID=1926292 RepID=UPI00352B4A24
MSLSVRNYALAIAMLLLSAGAFFVGWDFLQLSRRLPELVAAEERADLVTVDKSARTLTLSRGGTVLATYPVSLGSTPAGHKTREGDGRTPEGRYVIDSKNGRSRFHLALHVSYPNTEDSERARQQGVAPGGDIMIHGLRNGMSWLGKLHLLRDWTDGCVAVTNREIEDIWARVAPGTPIDIRL